MSIFLTCEWARDVLKPDVPICHEQTYSDAVDLLASVQLLLGDEMFKQCVGGADQKYKDWLAERPADSLILGTPIVSAWEKGATDRDSFQRSTLYKSSTGRYHARLLRGPAVTSTEPVRCTEVAYLQAEIFYHSCFPNTRRSDGSFLRSWAKQSSVALRRFGTGSNPLDFLDPLP